MQSIKKMIITNNPMVYERFDRSCRIDYDPSFSFLDVLIRVRDNIHTGRHLLTHPLSGSVKPYNTPYKTVLLTDSAGSLDTDGLAIIEKSIETTEKFSKSERKLSLSEKLLEDYQIVDFDLIKDLV